MLAKMYKIVKITRFLVHSRTDFLSSFPWHCHSDIGNVYLPVLSKASGKHCREHYEYDYDYEDPWLWQGKLDTKPLFNFQDAKRKEKIKSSPSYILLGWVWGIGKTIKIIWNGTSSQGANISKHHFLEPKKKFFKEFTPSFWKFLLKI